jgi:cytochrome c oxidase subunit 2
MGLSAVLGILLAPICCPSSAQAAVLKAPINTFAPLSTPASEINELAYFVLFITGGIFVAVGSLIVIAIVRGRRRRHDDTEPAQIYGSVQVELAWTVLPVLTVIVLFLATARVIFAVQDAPKPVTALDVTVIGHQFWWEYRYPKLGIVTANELHIPLSDGSNSKPTYLQLLSSDVVHSFWVPQLAGKTDLLPSQSNSMWMNPLRSGLYLGQCSQFCGVQHAKMLLRVYVDTPDQFAQWIKKQQQPAAQDVSGAAGRRVFETQACMNCHTIAGTAATGRFGPDLTHLMSRATLASGVIPNNPQNLREWIKCPDEFKTGCLMPAMQLDDQQLDVLVAYLSTLR